MRRKLFWICIILGINVITALYIYTSFELKKEINIDRLDNEN